MSDSTIAGVLCYGLSIGAGIAVAVGWYGLATTLGLSALLFALEASTVYLCKALSRGPDSRND